MKIKIDKEMLVEALYELRSKVKPHSIMTGEEFTEFEQTFNSLLQLIQMAPPEQNNQNYPKIISKRG